MATNRSNFDNGIVSNGAVSNYVQTTNYPDNGISWTYAYPTYATTADIAELRGKIDVLEKMVAALLSGREMPKRKAKRA